ncbi:MAG: SpaA isopeptide-forming pilin-related protein, partial [Coriobacteriia bacterium]|nr:SpaA isopeptide-forming pilin-related protein [Coriobacteriia bacterium]
SEAAAPEADSGSGGAADAGDAQTSPEDSTAPVDNAAAGLALAPASGLQPQTGSLPVIESAVGSGGLGGTGSGGAGSGVGTIDDGTGSAGSSTSGSGISPSAVIGSDDDGLSPFEKGWKLGDPRIPSFGTAATFPLFVPTSITNGVYPDTIQAYVQMPVDPDWALATATQGYYPGARVQLIGYNDNDYVWGHVPDSESYYPSPDGFANNSAIHCIDPGKNAPDYGGAGIITLNFYRIVSWNGQDWYEYFGYGKMPGYQNYYGDFSQQNMALYVRIPAIHEGYININKSSASPTITDQNGLYSMDGIKYYIYDTAALTNRVGSITLDETGFGFAGPLPYGNFWLQEAPKAEWAQPARSSGYAQSTAVLRATLSAFTPLDHNNNQAVFLDATDTALASNVGVLVKKIDSTTGTASGQDGNSLAGAQFTVRYWDGYYKTVSAAEGSGAPTRTWVIETSSNGSASLANTVAGSSALYYSATGSPVIPLGTVVIQETKAPDGYLLPSPNAAYLQQVTLDSDLTGVVGLNVTTVSEVPRSLLLQKTDAQTKAVVAGAEFKLYQESTRGAGDWKQAYGTKKTDSQGQVTWSPMQAGSYKVVETKAPAGYMLPSEAGFSDENTFVVSASSTTAVTTVSYSDYQKAQIKALKTDTQTGEPVAGTEFTLYRYPGLTLKNGVLSSDVSKIMPDDPAWQAVSVQVAGDDGRVAFPDLAYGYYQIKETRANPAYMSPAEAGTEPAQLVIIDSKLPSTTVNLAFGDYQKAQIEALKTDTQTGEPVADTEFTLYRYPGLTLKNGVLSSDVSQITPDDPAWQEQAVKVTGDDGLVDFSGLAYGYYQIKETRANPAYMSPAEAGTEPTQLVIIDRQLPSTTVRLAFDDYQKAQIEALKTDTLTGEPVADTEFTLYCYPGLVLKDGVLSSDVSQILPDDPDWQEVAVQVTGDDGRVAFPDLAYGYYQIKETRANPAYMSPAEAGTEPAQLVIIDRQLPSTTASFTFDDYEDTTVTGQKTDIETDAPIPDTEFTLYRYPQIEVVDGRVVTDTSAILSDDPAWQEVGQTVTDEDGKFSFTGLPYGFYQLRETKPNPLYKSNEETSKEAPRLLVIDRDFTGEAQVFSDELIKVSVEVYKKTISKTSSALDGSPEDAANNVGSEEYQYQFGARNTSNCYLDEFVITDDLTPLTAQGLRLTTLWTGTSPAGLDFDGRVAVLYQTNKTAKATMPLFAQSPLQGNPDNPNNPQKAMYLSEHPGFKVWKEGLSTTASSRLDVSALGLADGEYVTAIMAVYGGVDKDFYTGSGYAGSQGDPNSLRTGDQTPFASVGKILDWEYSVVATKGLRPYSDDAQAGAQADGQTSAQDGAQADGQTSAQADGQ